MNDWIYPEVIECLKEACRSFLEGKITIQDIQSEIYKAENQIVALEEKWLRTILFDAENEIELLIYTVDEKRLDESVISIIKNILTNIG
ncbi:MULTISPECIES: hypothetical protein [Photorhabdus]|uniref:Uncharacterized protein n=1 Tax=Photorhabdus namnaonensis TaxID=1851568 RepID=A0A1B8YD81_9GAMM|nr:MULTISPECIES: hypothetical protein [Photorhabdus]MBS9432568.1 hypothetical protein [Photorhabdus hainanensis]MCC8459508.1 hypothetical protein [Photorhabdus aegyptia]OCA53124.1 hypothetical protein Phpb_03791 [Photorhabdus namnaonensis]